MKNSNKILIGIRGSQLSRAQTQIFINEANKIDKISNSHSFDIKIIHNLLSALINDCLKVK